jgi:uncharacterized cupin superfamily protein
LYVVVEGVDSVRHEAGFSEVRAGDCFLFGPGEAHQIINQGKDELEYYVIADNPFGTSCYYRDSRKWMVGQPSERTILKGEQTDYYDGEE